MNADNDMDNDHNGILKIFDLISGPVTLTNAEPLGDGDLEDCWFDNDRSGNMTVDFGFYNPSLYVLGGDVDTDWANAGNWIGGVVPDATSDVTIIPQRPFFPLVDEHIVIQKLELQTGACIDVMPGFSFDVLCP